MGVTRGAIAAGDTETANAAAEMLRDGGNAFDAALAALCTACIAEPVLCSLGGGGFLLARPATGEAVLYDFFCQTPRAKRPAAALDFHPVTVDFGTATQGFQIGMGAVATPGAVAGLFAVHKDLGSLPIARILEPAIGLARRGVPISRLQAQILGIVEPIYVATQSARALFESRREPGHVLREGEVYRPEAMAGALDALAREGPALFYRGAIAREFVEAGAGGGMLGMDDLAHYRVIRRRPLERGFAGARILTNPPPSSGGPLIVFALAMLEEDLAGGGAPDDPEWLGLLAGAMAVTNAARHGVALDEGCDEARVAALLSDPVVSRYRAQMRGRALKQGGTTHIGVVDSEGNAAALSLSNGEGCGQVLPGCAIMPNNMLGEEDINPRGFHEWTPDTRISSMMAPTLLERPGGGLILLGSGGSNRIRTAILQVIANVLRFGMGLGDAVAAPRIHYERGLLDVEAVGAAGGFDPARIGRFLDGFERTELWDSHSIYFGGVHAVALDPASGAFDGAGDKRRGGVYLEV